MASPMPPSLAGVRVRVPAKINLALKVGPPRADGFHPLATVYQAVSLYDEVYVSWQEPGVFTVDVAGEGAHQVPADEDNLAVRAARLLASSHPDADELGAAISITKAIPVSGGLAGGSADGAAALVACSALWDLGLDTDDLLGLAAELGSDVPFALVGGTAMGSGRGEVVAPALARGSYHWVLAFGHHGLSTPAVYRHFDALHPDAGQPSVPDALMNALRNGDPHELGAALDNDLQRAALDLQPQLQRTLDAGFDYGALGGVVSGSGPTCAFLMATEAAAIDLCVALSADGLSRAVRRVTGPVAGARVIG